MGTRTKASKAHSRSRTRLGIRYFDDRVLLTDTYAWAYYRIPSVSYEFTTPEEREALATNIAVALAALGNGECIFRDLDDRAGRIGIGLVVFDPAKSIDRVTITVYQSAAGNNILTWLQNAVDKLISALGNAIYFPYLAPVVILGAMWLAWQGLIRKRATRTIEGTLWMVVAATAAIALISRPADFTGVGTTVSNGVTGVLNTAFARLPAPANSNCLPVTAGDPQSVAANYAFTSGNGLVDENANELWSVLVCKPWLYGEFGTTQYSTPGQGPQTVVDTYGRALLWSQAFAANETPTTALAQAKQSTYAGIAAQLQQNDPAIYPLFQGNQWTTRLEIAFAAMFAALVAGLLILLIALTLIVLKLGFLLLLVAGPFFLIVGTHPGFGRIIAIRWFEMLVGVLMKQAAIAIVLSVLLYCYSLIMGTSDAALPWALKILMIALVTVAVFIYRKPFTHLFSAVSQVVGVATDEDCEGTVSAHDTVDAIARAGKYLLKFRGQTTRRRRPSPTTSCIPTYRSCRAKRAATSRCVGAAALGQLGGGLRSEGWRRVAIQEPTLAAATVISFAKQQLGNRNCPASPRVEVNDGGLERLGVVERHIGDQVPDHREGPHRRDGQGLVGREDRHPGHAGQPRPAVDLHRARPALAGLAVPPDGQVVGLGGRQPVQDVQHDLALVDLDLVVG